MGVFTPFLEYKLNIERILTELRKTNATIIWATTTPVNNNNINCNNTEIDEYNRKIGEFMVKEHIEINDLNSIVKKDIKIAS